MSQVRPASSHPTDRPRADGSASQHAPDADDASASPDAAGRPRYDTLFRDSADVMLVIDPTDGRIVDANHAAEAFYGYDRDRLLTLPITEINTDPPDRIRANLSRVAAGAQRFFHFKHRLASGETRDVQVSSSRVEIEGRALLLSIVHDISDQMAAEQAVRNSQALLDRAESIAHVGSWRMDLATGTVSWSREMSRIFEVNPSGPDFRAVDAISQAIHPDDRAMIEEVNAATLRDGVPRPADYRILHSDGTVRWVHAEGVQELDDSGRAIAMVGFVQDITARKEAEAELRAREIELRRSEGKYRTVLEQSPVPIAAHRAGRGIFANEAHRRLFGYSSLEEVTGLDVDDMVAPESRAMVHEIVGRRLHGLPAEGEYEMLGLRADGTTFPTLVKSVPIELPDGPATLIFQLDLTEAKRAEEALRASEEKFAKAFQAAPLLISLADLSTGLWVDVNEEALRLTGFSRDEVVGHSAVEIGWITDEDRLRLREELQTKGRIVEMEMECRAKDGRKIVGLVSGELISVLGRQCLLTVTVDITERRRVEAERERLQVELAQSQKMEAVGRLAGGIAHDFNNLLTAIGGYARILEADLTNGAGDPEDAAEIRRAADRAAALTAKLLAFAGRHTVQPVAIDLATAVGQILPMLRRIVPERIRIVTELFPGPAIDGDPAELDQVVVNLVANAADAIAGIGIVAVRTSAVDHDEEFVRAHLNARPGPHARLAVTDTGSGISEAVRARIFEPFFTTKDVGQGTGLGLATVYAVVERMGGTIEVRSSPETGTAFEIDLPASRSPAAVAVAPVAPAELPARRGAERILLVEDEPMVRKFATAALLRLGYRVIAAETPADAAGIRASDYDLLVTDVVMPGMVGTELVRTLRHMRPDLPVLFVSGYSQGTVSKAALEEPRTALLSKPFTPSELADAVRRLLDGAPET